MRCPRVAAAFRRSVNLTPSAIRAWAGNPASREASLESTRRRLPALADLRAKSPADWTARDCRLAQRVVSFNARFDGMIRVHGPTRKACVAERNWGRRGKGC